jgi:hypothetical protein
MITWCSLALGIIFIWCIKIWLADAEDSKE